jgi:cytochrome c biogenesis protein
VKLPKFITARSTVISLLIAVAGALLLASSLPQQASLGGKTPPWVARLPEGLGFLASALSLDNIVGSTWFAVLIALFWCSLAVSTASQFSATRALSRRVPPAALPPGCSPVELPPEEFARLARAAGYLPAGSAPGVQRFVKHRAGYWGNFLLHIGLVTAVLCSLVYVLTQHRVLVRLVGQQITTLSDDNILEVRGILPQKDGLPYSALLKAVTPRFWPNDKLQYLSSELYFTKRPGGDPTRVEVALSDKSRFGSYLVYQANAYGRAFDLELVPAAGSTRRVRLFLPYPGRRDLAGYGELALEGTGYLLKAKFYASAGKGSMQLDQPPLTLRLYRGKDLVQQAMLTGGEPSTLGPFTVRLAGSEWWSDILLDGSRGTAGIFAGFAIILCGVLCSYCLIPREIIVRQNGGALQVQQVVRRFAGLYREEFDDLLQKTREGTS